MKRYYNVSASPGAGNNFIENLILDIETQSSVPFMIHEELGHCHDGYLIYKSRPEFYDTFETSLYNDKFLTDPLKYIRFCISFTQAEYIRIECNHFFKHVMWKWDRNFILKNPSVDDRYFNTVDKIFPNKQIQKFTELTLDECRLLLETLDNNLSKNNIGDPTIDSIELKYFDILNDPKKIITKLEKVIGKQATDLTYLSYYKYLNIQKKLKEKYFPWCKI